MRESESFSIPEIKTTKDLYYDQLAFQHAYTS